MFELCSLAFKGNSTTKYCYLAVKCSESALHRYHAIPISEVKQGTFHDVTDRRRASPEPISESLYPDLINVLAGDILIAVILNDGAIVLIQM